MPPCICTGADDLGRYASAVRPSDGAELSKQSFGPFRPFGKLRPALRRATDRDAQTIARHLGATEVDVTVDTP